MAARQVARSGPPRIGILGFGRMAEGWHLPAFGRAGCEVVAALDVTEARRERARALGIPVVCDNLKSFLEADIDAALIATHSAVRSEAALPLAKAGVHLLIEKPLSTTGAEAKKIVAQCKKSRVVLSVYHNRRWDPDYQIVKAMVQSGFIGQLVSIENRMFHQEPATSFGAREFKQEWRITQRMGGGTLLDWGPHLIDQALDLAGHSGKPVAVKSVWADVRHVRYGDADDHFQIDMLFSNGVRALVSKSDVTPKGPNYKWLVTGTNGSLVYAEDKLLAKANNGQERSVDRGPATPSLHRNFRDAIEGKDKAWVTPEQALRVVLVMDAARKSAKEGKSVAGKI